MIQQKKQSPALSKELSRRGKSILAQFKTGKCFAAQFNLDFCLSRYSTIQTITQGLSADLIKLGELNLAYGDKITALWIESWLVNIASYMDFSISSKQASSTAMFIKEECYMLNIGELTLLFKRIFKGKYGQFYGKFNGQTIIGACVEFRNERGKIISKMSSEEQEALLNY